MNNMKQRRSMTIRTAASVLLCGVATAAIAHHEGGDMFKMMDSNNDGKISAQEHAAAVTKMFGEMDANGDGFVSDAEYRAQSKAAGRMDEGKPG